ncbi:probable multidrug resistance-associated protein lethal(2)03659 isoform X2 [Zophobas morio]|uniref:probable multidrug resistance-associated protein lethal(2)03659 isoform X2 n=1 Tax=Zophobas morio TaxID=2755281 RepID=UPI003083BCBC
MDTKEKIENKPNPVEKANVFSSLIFLFKRELNEDDLFEPLDEHKASLLGTKLEQAWKEENVKHKQYGLHIALLKVFGSRFMLFGFLRLFDEVMMEIVPPFCIGRLLSYYEGTNSDVSETEAYLQALAIALCLILNALLTHPPYMGLMHLTMKMRIACSSLIYRKMLKLSKTALAETTTGQIINLLSNDVSKFDQGFMLAHYVWIAPIHAVIGTYFLYRQIGISAFFGVVLLVAFIPVQIMLGKRTSVLRLRTALRTDERVRLINEIISGIQVIKMYCWEKPFGKLVSMARRKEMSAIRDRALIQGMFYSFETTIARTSVFLSILGYVLMGSRITAEKVFTIKAIYDVLRSVLILHFWISASSIAETNVSVSRIQKFLSSPDRVDTTTRATSSPRILLENVTAKWQENPGLERVSFNVASSQTMAVIGPVGSGKSSLLNLLLNELPVESGRIDVQGNLSYSSQEPWLFSGSVRQNIIFNNEYDEERYRRVVEVCALKSDFQLFPFGDQTLVGEKGRALSGGQKARINLARCVYNEADIYLLDDPLSAVDANVGKHLYEKCIREFLKGKICVLVTHQLQYLSDVDRIVVMKNGEIESEGTFNELQTKGLDFGKLLEQFKNEDQGEESKKWEEGVDDEELKDDDNEKPLVETEKVKRGSIKWSLYLKYLKAGGGTTMVLVMSTLFLSAHSVANAGDYYISYWVNSERRFNEKVLNNMTAPNETLDRNPMIYTYSGLILGTIVLSFTESLYFMFHLTVASINLHEMSFSTLLNAAMRFFNNNPSGRILNRFSKDMGYIDEYIPSVLFDVIQVALMLFGSLILSFIVDVWLLIPSAFLISVFFVLRIIYIRTSRRVKRIEGVTRSPILGHAATSIQGLSTIRSFSAQEVLIREFDDYQDRHSSAWYLFIAANRCFGFWVDFICITFFAVGVFVLMYFNKNISGGDIGLVITQYTTFISSLQWELRQLSELENTMVSVERLLEYKNLESEPVRKKTETVSQTWPKQGKIEFRHVSMKYNPSDSHILKNLSFTIHPQEKIGIVGRTGAGKSSIITALFQLYPIEGTILMDEVDSTGLPLEDVRSKISIIPQEPVLFSGSLRKNLDPFDEYSDEAIWDALKQVELKNIVSGGLDTNVAEGGGNFSVGQRQLVCLARALVRRNKILVMDEATANVDPQTDAVIQNTIREKFAECTVLTIAHRLQTVMDSDRIIVMSAGSLEEFDHPYNLIKKEGGVLHNLVQNMGKAAAATLESIAKKSYEKRKLLIEEPKE